MTGSTDTSTTFQEYLLTFLFESVPLYIFLRLFLCIVLFWPHLLSFSMHPVITNIQLLDHWRQNFKLHVFLLLCFKWSCVLWANLSSRLILLLLYSYRNLLSNFKTLDSSYSKILSQHSKKKNRKIDM